MGPMNNARKHCSREKSQKVTDWEKKKKKKIMKRERASGKRKTRFPNSPIV